MFLFLFCFAWELFCMLCFLSCWVSCIVLSIVWREDSDRAGRPKKTKHKTSHIFTITLVMLIFNTEWPAFVLLIKRKTSMLNTRVLRFVFLFITPYPVLHQSLYLPLFPHLIDLIDLFGPQGIFHRRQIDFSDCLSQKRHPVCTLSTLLHIKRFN